MRARNYSLCYKVDAEETPAGEVAKPEDSQKRASRRSADRTARRGTTFPTSRLEL